MEKIIGLLFLARDLAHREHLLTTNYAAHMALQTFYVEVVELADRLAETTMGRFGAFDTIPMVDNEYSGEIADVLEEQMGWIEDNRYEEMDKGETAIHNVLDEVVALYLQTLYKLRRFK